MRGDPDWIRTSGPQIRNLMLYPAELRDLTHVRRLNSPPADRSRSRMTFQLHLAPIKLPVFACQYPKLVSRQPGPPTREFRNSVRPRRQMENDTHTVCLTPRCPAPARVPSHPGGRGSRPVRQSPAIRSSASTRHIRQSERASGLNHRHPRSGLWPLRSACPAAHQRRTGPPKQYRAVRELAASVALYAA